MAYSTTVLRLLDDGYDWVDVLPKSVDELVFDTLKPLETEQPIYNPYLVEKNLTALGASIQTCLDLRVAASNLAEKAVRQALEYDVFQKNAEHVKAIERADWIKDQIEAERTQHLITKSAFDSATHPLSDGFSSDAKAKLESSSSILAGDKTRRRHVEEKWANIIEHQRVLQERHSEPGHPLNYIERAERIRELLVEELKTLYWRARATAAGLEHVFGFEPTQSKLPEILDPNDQNHEFNSFLDELAVWSRKSARALSAIKQYEHVYEHTISVNGHMHSGTLLLEEASFKTAMDGDGKVRINLKDYFPTELGRVRLLGVSLSMDTNESTNKANMVAQKHTYSRAIVVLPGQRNLYSDGSKMDVPPVIVNNVSTTNPDAAIPYLKGGTFENADPAAGEWTIQVANFIGYVDRGRRERTQAYVKDLKLHLLLASNANNEFAVWDNDFWGKK